MSRGACQSCGSHQLEEFYEALGAPSQSCILLDTESEARSFPTGDITLALCATCGFIQNAEFDLSLIDYTLPTEESQAFSGRFREFAEALAHELVERYELVDRSVLEVGCGKGEFLEHLAGLGLASAIGIDPGFLDDRLTESTAVTFLRDWFGPTNTHLTGDLVVSRHLMEHIPNVGEYFRYLRQSVERSSTGAMFTEVPDTTRVLEEGAFWDVYHEHCSYWTVESLKAGLEIAGFTVDWIRLAYGNQYILTGATLGAPEDLTFEPDVVRARVGRFSELSRAKAQRWTEEIERTLAEGRAVTVWGGGSKAVAFLTTLGFHDVTVVDINPYKQGKWLPGAAVEVRDPKLLIDVDPALVIAMNPIYLDEIDTDLRGMGLAPRLVAVD